MAKMILNDKTWQIRTGYPTLSDKYNAKGGILVGTEDALNGSVVKYSGTIGHYEVVSVSNPLTDIKELAGIVLATNIKLAGIYPDNKPNTPTHPGEEFNLFLNGGIAVALASGVEASTIKEGDRVYVTADGKFTNVAASNFEWPNAEFTGITDKDWNDPTIIAAEIFVR